MRNGISATSRRSSGTTSTRNSRPASTCASIRCCIGPSSMCGATRSARASRWSSSISRATGGATARWAAGRAPGRWRARRPTSTRSSPSSRARASPSAPAAPRTRRPRTPSSGCAPADTCEACGTSSQIEEVAMSDRIRQKHRGRAFPIAIVGHVDHGKSTLIGRLLHDTGSLPEGKVAALQEASRKRGMPFEWSFVMDALKVERDQGITIDTTRMRFKSERRDYVIIDAPGHAEFLKNMLTGAAAAEAAILVIDVIEGMSEQTRRHAFLLKLLGIREIVVAVNKMDRCDYAREAFDQVTVAASSYLAGLGLNASAIVPIS